MTETIVIVAGLLVTVIAMLLVSKFNISLFGLKLSFSKPDRLNIVHGLVHLATDYKTTIIDHGNSILKSQMTYVEGILLKIEEKLLLTYPKDQVIIAQNRAHLFLKDCMVKNGFASLTSSEFLNYVSIKIIELRKLYDSCLSSKSEFVDSHEFSSIINEIFTHSATCAEYWTKKIKDATVDYQKEYDSIIKRLV